MKKRTITYIIVILIMLAIAIGVFITRKHKENTEELKTIKVNEVTRSVFYAPQYIAINNENVNRILARLLGSYGARRYRQKENQ